MSGLALLRKEADLGELVQDALDVTAARFARAGLALHPNIAAPLVLACNPRRVRQVIDNLVENALRDTDAPGAVPVAAWRDATGVQLVVEDTAPVPPETSMPHFFHRFHRGETSRSRALGGSGLGLSICKAIVDAHAGQIIAEVTQMGGLRVHVTLPDSAKRDKRFCVPKRILIVEDEPDLAEVIRDYLHQAGMQADTLSDGHLAVNTILATAPDLVVLDIMLPGQDGLTICREMRAESDVPIVLETARVEEIDRLLGLEPGADDDLCAPFSPCELGARIKASPRRVAPPDATPHAPVTRRRQQVP